jgi:lysozyme
LEGSLQIDSGQSLTKFNEGYREGIYLDSRGYPTTGYGMCLDSSRTYKSISEYHETQFLKNYSETERNFDRFGIQLDPVRKAAVVDLIYNLGFNKFLRFNNTISALRTGAWHIAAEHLKDSLWYQQVGDRAERICNLIRTGDWNSINERKLK